MLVTLQAYPAKPQRLPQTLALEVALVLQAAARSTNSSLRERFETS